MATLLASNLKKHGFDVQHAADGIEACAHLLIKTFDAIITDIQMPHMDGLELLKLVRKDFPNIPVLLMTGATYLTESDALDRGAAALLFKPQLTAASLAEALARVVGG